MTSEKYFRFRRTVSEKHIRFRCKHKYLTFQTLMFFMTFLFLIISLITQAEFNCSTDPACHMEETKTNDQRSGDDSGNSESMKNIRTRMSVSTDDCTEVHQNKADNSVGMALVLYNEENILPLHKTERSFDFAGHEIKIKQNWSSLGVAAVVWDAAIVLCHYLEANPTEVQDKTVIELGAGTGIVGIVSSYLGGKTTVTDRVEVLDFLRRTVNENTPVGGKMVLNVEALDWTKDLSDFGKFDVILGADIVYIEEVFDDLLRTLAHLSNTDTVIFLSCRIRYDRDTIFLSKLENDFVVKEILYDVKTDVKLFKANKR